MCNLTSQIYLEENVICNENNNFPMIPHNTLVKRWREYNEENVKEKD